MAVLSNAIKNVFDFFRKESFSQHRSQDKTKKAFQETKESNTLRRKRGASEESEPMEVITKRRRVDREQYAPIVGDEVYESTRIEGFTEPVMQQPPVDARQDTDRAMMPPPLLTPTKFKSNTRFKQLQEEARYTTESDVASQTSYNTKSTRLRLEGELMSDYDMEKAKRHAAATQLPANSGAWERGEKELFYHLAYRGCEPLLPANWMKDFPTLPISLYAVDDEQLPLIQNNLTREFRAIRELRELLEVGKNVRDGVLASPGMKRERVIEKACAKYFSWALLDAGLKISHFHKSTSLQVKPALPIHVVVTLKKGQSTTDCLLELKYKLHTLASQHRRFQNVRMSVELDPAYGTPEAENETVELEADDDDLPTLYGIMICRGILAIFTMNSQTPLPPNFVPSYMHSPNKFPTPATSTSPLLDKSHSKTNLGLAAQQNRGNDADAADNDSASDPRFISDFDFSDASRDVWNALVIAILAMQIRTDMLILKRARGIEEDMDEALENMSRMDVDSDDDPDA